MGTVLHDLRHAVRRLLKSPGLSASAVLALTLGIGMPTIMFTIVNGVFRELPVEDPEEIVRIVQFDVVRGGQRWSISHHDFADLAARQSAFVNLAGFDTEDVTLSGGDARPLRRNAAFVTANMFDVLGVDPIVGRSFSSDDEGSAAVPVALISHGLWQSRFAGDSSVAGAVLRIDGSPHSVIGVMPEQFGFPAAEDVWLPLTLSRETSREDSPSLQAIGRIHAGIAVTQAGLDLHAVSEQLAREFPDTNRDLRMGVLPFGASVIDPAFSRGLLTMLGAVSFVLLIACVNVANLQLARAIGRTRDIAIRGALGASRLRVMMPLLLESLIIATVGGVLGAVVAWRGVELFKQALTSLVGVAWVDIRIDGMVLLFVAGIALLGAILGGILPARQASRVESSSILNDAARGTSGPGLRIGNLGRGLVVAEIALSCALLSVSGLLINGVMKLRAIDLGMPAEQIVTGEVELPRQVYATLEDRVSFFQELESSVANIPGVTASALASDIPGTIGFQMPVTPVGQDADRSPPVSILTVSPGFFDAVGATVLDGRGFEAQDRADSEPVLLVNQSFADLTFPGQRAVGRTVQLGSTQRTVIGLVPDLLMGSMEEEGVNGPGVYLPLGQTGNVSMQVFARTSQDPLALTNQIRDALEAMDPTIALMDVDRVDRLIARETQVFDVFARLFLVFGGVALVLASIGLYGVMSFTVRQRTSEWGVRMALGATGPDVIKLATGRAGTELGIGLLIGLGIGGLFSMPLSNFFYQVKPWDVAVFGAVALLLAITGILAALAPARRATRIDPLEALRYD